MSTMHPTWELQYLSWEKGVRVLLNGIEVEECVGFNEGEGYIERLARDEWGGYLWTGPRFKPCQAIERVYGVVTIERELPCSHTNQRQGERGPAYCADCGEEIS